MMDPRQQQQQVPASFRSLFAALDVIIEEAVKDYRGGLMARHAEWHDEMKNKPSAGCHTCVLVGMVNPDNEDKGEAAPVPEPLAPVAVTEER